MSLTPIANTIESISSPLATEFAARQPERGQSADAQPTGDVVPVGRIVFPFAAELRDGRDLARVPVERTGTGPEIEETYTVDAHGVVRATITDLESGFCVTTAL